MRIDFFVVYNSYIFYIPERIDEEYEIEYVDDTEGLEGVDGEGVKKSEDFLDELDDDSSSTSDAWK